jgi:hypothetical protein
MSLYVIQTPQFYLFRDFAPKSYRREFIALHSLIKLAYQKTSGTAVWLHVYDESEVSS